jgi:hypothetical protein
MSGDANAFSGRVDDSDTHVIACDRTDLSSELP